MENKGLECVAIVENTNGKMTQTGDKSNVRIKGKLIGNLSASDLRGITTDKMDMLKLPVFDFLQTVTGTPPTMTVIDVHSSFIV
jgi:hypothetical protein